MHGMCSASSSATDVSWKFLVTSLSDSFEEVAMNVHMKRCTECEGFILKAQSAKDDEVLEFCTRCGIVGKDLFGYETIQDVPSLGPIYNPPPPEG